MHDSVQYNSYLLDAAPQFTQSVKEGPFPLSQLSFSRWVRLLFKLSQPANRATRYAISETQEQTHSVLCSLKSEPLTHRDYLQIY